MKWIQGLVLALALSVSYAHAAPNTAKAEKSSASSKKSAPAKAESKSQKKAEPKKSATKETKKSVKADAKKDTAKKTNAKASKAVAKKPEPKKDKKVAAKKAEPQKDKKAVAKKPEPKKDKKDKKVAAKKSEPKKDKKTVAKVSKAATPKTNAVVTGQSLRERFVRDAHKYIGTPYKWEGASPRGFDCSGYTSYLTRKHGFSIPRTSRDQFSALPRSNGKRGDLVFFYKKGARVITHVGIYLGNGKMIHAPQTGSHVKVVDINTSYWQKRFAGFRDPFVKSRQIARR